MNEELIKKKVQPLSSNSDLKPKDHKRKTTLMLSAITCLFMCVLGYEMVREESNDTHGDGPKRIEIVTPQKTHQGFNTDQRQLALLNAQNQHLSQKILSFKDEAKNASERLHTMQVAMTAVQKKVESEKVIALQGVIREKEKAQQALQNTIANLEAEIADHKEQILSMEASIETFQEMIELHKRSKDQLIANYKSKLDHLQTALDEEKSLLLAQIHEIEGSKHEERERLTHIILDLEERQKLLQNESAEHAEEIAFLENELNKYSLIALQKDEELDSIYTSQKENDSRVQDLATIIQLEQLLSSQNETELHYLSSSHAAKEQAIRELELSLDNSKNRIAEVETLLASHTTDLMAKEDAINVLQETQQLSQKEYEARIHALAKNLDSEKQAYEAQLIAQESELSALKALNETLGQEILKKEETNTTLAFEKQHQEAKLKSLESDLEHKLVSIEKLEEQLSLLDEDSSKAKLAHETRERSLTEELAALQKLNGDLQVELSLLSEEKVTLEAKMHEASDLQLALQDKLREHENDLASKAEEIERLKASFDQSHEELAALQQELSQALIQALEQNKTHESTIAELQKELDSIITKSAVAEAKNTSLETELGALQQKLEEQQLSYRLLEENDTRSLTIETQAKELELTKATLAKIQSEYDSERQNAFLLESQIDSLKNSLTNYENALASQSEEFNRSLEAKNQELEVVERSLKEALSHYEEAIARADSLEGEVTELNKLAREKELVFAEAQFQSERLNEELTQYQQSLESTLAAFEIEQNKSQTFQAKLDELSQAMIVKDDEFNKQKLELASLSEKHALAETKLGELELKLVHLNQVLDASTQELARKNEESLLQRWENEKMSQELAEAFAVNDEVSLRSNALESKLEELASLISMREQAIAELENTNQNRLDEMSKKSFELADTLSRYEFEQAKARELERQLAELNVAIHHKEEEINQSQEFSATQREMNEKLIAELTKHQAALSEALTKYELAEETLLKHEEILKSLEQQLTEKQQQLEESEDTLSVRTRLANELMETIASLSESKAKLQKELERARGDFAKLVGTAPGPAKLPLGNLEGIDPTKRD